MSLFSVQARKHTAYYDNLMLTSMSKTPGRERPAVLKATDTTLGKGELTSGESACEDRRSSGKSRHVNRTYVISAVSKSGSGQQTPYRGRLTLQRRSRRKTGADTAEKTMAESTQNTTPASEKRLTLQRRTRTPSMNKNVYGQRVVSGCGLQATPKVLSEPNCRTPALFRSVSLKESASRNRGRETGDHVESQGRVPQGKMPLSSSSFSTSKHLDDQAQSFKTPTRKTPFEKIAAKREVFERLAGKEIPRPVAVKSASLEKPKSRVQQDTKPVAAPRVSKTPAGALQVKKNSISNQKGDVIQANTFTPIDHHVSHSSEALKQQGSFKMEDSAVTVAVRVRPFNARWVM